MQNTSSSEVPESPASCGLATASLVCGICGVFLGPLTGIPAIITGHIALGRIKSSGGFLKGRGLAIAGLILGYVFSVIFVLAMLGFSAGNAAIQKARKVTCIATAISIESACSNFYTEYGYMPQNGKSDVTVLSDVDIAVLEELLGFSTKVNTRGVQFLSAREGKNGKNGLIYKTGGHGVLGLYDPWGGGYKIRMDLDLDEKLDVDGKLLSGRRVAVWSDGPDRLPGTQDDVKTW